MGFNSGFKGLMTSLLLQAHFSVITRAPLNILLVEWNPLRRKTINLYLTILNQLYTTPSRIHFQKIIHFMESVLFWIWKLLEVFSKRSLVSGKHIIRFSFSMQKSAVTKWVANLIALGGLYETPPTNLSFRMEWFKFVSFTAI